ncbi:hypothetical protein M409DRAFT_25469 [Zasmidium cellare ATCC 36951]|uniref:BTB domain-containing protein n=1 Tax=Zasmidium cellare ATCC 36951 TaxID=1080233 RepID=A0A6A6CBF5_ZASCE|nr:uncharacterized protein M409DRAFT_25469 [Zasmidium cellare ATCC 36951]KAF2164123.1 hypothetical protein M409DRAFT_25469 [Zasmidium cellare ATCC 36951]
MADDRVRSNEPTDFILVSSTGQEFGVHRAVMAEFSPTFWNMTTNPYYDEFRTGRYVFQDYKASTVKALKCHMYDETYDWWNMHPEAKALHFTELWNLAHIFLVKDLAELVMADFLHWTCPKDVTGPDDSQYVHQAIGAVCENQHVPAALWQLLVDQWATFLTNEESNGRGELYKILGIYPGFSEAVRIRVAHKAPEQSN